MIENRENPHRDRYRDRCDEYDPYRAFRDGPKEQRYPDETEEERKDRIPHSEGCDFPEGPEDNPEPDPSED